MPVDSSGMPQQPNDLGSLGRRLVAAERQLQLGAGARSLTMASIGRGGIRVIKGGDIRIEGTGSLIIETGNLVLGAGKIEGEALASQLEPQAYRSEATNVSLTTSYATKTSLYVTAPVWATRTIVQAYGVGSLRYGGGGNTKDLNATMRLLVASSTSAEVVLTAAAASTAGNTFHASNSLSHAQSVDTSKTKTFTVGLQAFTHEAGSYPANAASRVTLDVVALFFR